ncbi:MAG: two-component sensor histidine kinase, partial [Rickettsiaceae bacterium]|nr:two-component sensor histidine kinase [Rickettsiaceae bacterium]
SEFIICTFADSGPGIPPEFREKVKERFFRMDVSRNTEGTGLGMSLVDAVAKLHNGRLELDDNNPGLKVSLIFPKEPLAGI